MPTFSPWPLLLGLGACALGGAEPAARQVDPPAPAGPQEPRIHDLEREPERTLRAGDGYRGRALGMEIEGAPRDRRDVTAWVAGITTAPRVEDGGTAPFASLYFWQRPDEDLLFRGVVAGVLNDLTLAISPAGFGEAELLFTLDTFTWPAASGELVDGVLDEASELYWGHVRPGLGFGFRRQIGPAQDNLLAANLVGEVGALYFGRGDRSAADFALPDSTLELRAKAQLRCDLLERNLLELPHAGFALGADLVFGHRADWDDWGSPATGEGDADATRNYAIASAYAFGITGLPFVRGERHRLLGSVHAGVGEGLDRFSAPRIGGGPDPRGEEFGQVARPILPGAAVGEFFPEHYVLGYAGYRVQPTWFAFVDAGATVGWLDRDRRDAGGAIRREDDVLTAVGTRLSTGFLGRTRIQVLYAYAFDVIRGGEAGGYEFSAQVTGFF
jgi:hypothetical protein